jgi:hypothetical protein
MDKQKTKRKFSRREFIKTGAAGLGVAALGSLPKKVFGQAPAVLRGTSLAILQGTYFVAPAQDLYKRQAQEWGKADRGGRRGWQARWRLRGVRPELGKGGGEVSGYPLRSVQQFRQLPN